jgi:hypothetical protein
MVLRGEKRSICILMEQDKHFVRVRRLSSSGAGELIIADSGFIVTVEACLPACSDGVEVGKRVRG